MELWTGALSSWKCHRPDLKSPGRFWGNLSWTPLKPQHSNPNPYSLANQLMCSDFLTPPTVLIIPHRVPAFLEFLMQLINWCSIHARWSKSTLKYWYFSVAFFLSLKQNFIAYRSSKVSSRPDCIFEIHQLWQSGLSRMYSNCCCSCSFKPEIIKIDRHLIRCIAITYWIFKSLQQFKMPVQKSLEIHWIYIYMYISLKIF